ncbi:hypothetical protein LTR36_001857 [Oleoguttula mirabilis]|uniref:Uncharacterized protein n=1 Tax=Oleoguttula mirabilis TaxID=1507867 RepID=A0AAV9JMS0_9PEZI|nr:hypothetical protein LTR36_001857 [Oleoguttula mirabilis]
MTSPQFPTTDILRQVLTEWGGRVNIDAGSKLLVSDTKIAAAIGESTKDIRTPYGPTITVATRGSGTDDASGIPEGVQVSLEPLDSLSPKMDYFTHAIFGLNGEDPKFVLEGLKWMKYALQPKGIAIVISLKQRSGEAADGQLQVDLDDRIKYQSRGKVGSLKDVLEWAGFERGKIRSMEMTSQGAEKVEAQVVLAMKWDQLTA